MKKIIVLTGFIFLLSVTEVISQRGSFVGIGGSFNNTWIGWVNAYGIKEFKNTKMKYYEPSYGYDASIAVGHNFVNVLGIRAEFGMSTQNQTFNNNDDNATRDVQLKYMQLPIMLRVATPGENFKVHLMFGPQFGFLSKATQSNITVEGNDPNNIFVTDANNNKVYPFREETITERYNKTDLQGIFDLGCDIAVAENLYLNLGIRVHASLKDINKSDWQYKDSPDVDYYVSRNMYGGINLGLTYSFENWYKMK